MRFYWPALLLSLGLPLLCRGGGPECAVWRDGASLGVRIEHPELFAGSLEQLLDSGFELVLHERLELLGSGGRMLARGTIDARAAYDLWSEEFVLLHHDGVEERRRSLRSRSEALGLLRRAEMRLPVEGLPAGPFRLRFSARLQPANAEQTEQSREWLSRSVPPGAAEDAAGTNLFTAFAHLLVTPDLEERWEVSYELGPWTLSALPAQPPPEAD